MHALNRSLLSRLGKWGAVTGLFVLLFGLGLGLEYLFAVPAGVERISPFVDVGYRMARFSFVDAERSTVRGDGLRGGYAPGISTYNLAERQRYRLLLYVREQTGLRSSREWNMERLEGITLTRDVHTHEPYDHSNGRVLLHGPSLIRYRARAPIDVSFLLPHSVMLYRGKGTASFTGGFWHDPGWHAEGARRIEVDDAEGTVAYRSLAIRISFLWTIDVSWGVIQVEPAARFFLGPGQRHRAQWRFPMRARVLKIGIRRRAWFPVKRLHKHPGQWPR